MNLLDVCLNPSVRPISVPPVARGVMQYHRQLPGYRATPLHTRAHLARLLGVRDVFVKDETSRLGLSSFKILGVSWAIARALSPERTPDGLSPGIEDLRFRATSCGVSTLVAATEGNHGRAVARMARVLQLKSRIYAPVYTPACHVNALQAERAELVHTASYDSAVHEAAASIGSGDVLISDVDLSSDGAASQTATWAIEGYSTLFLELESQLPAKPTVVAVQIGVGSLAAAAATHFCRTSFNRVRLIGVEPLSAASLLTSARAGALSSVDASESIMTGLVCSTPSNDAWHRVRNSFSLFVAIADDYAVAARQLLADVEIGTGYAGAAGLGGLLALRASEAYGSCLASTDTVVLIATEGRC